MKWFKHDTNARNDLRLKLLKKKFGLEGYGVYFSILEIIGEFASKNNVDEWGFVDKLHTTETLAEEIGIDPVKLDEIFISCNELGLFTQKEKRLYCEKILTRLDEYADKLRKQSGENRDSVDKISAKNKNKNKNKEEEQNKIINAKALVAYGNPEINLLKSYFLEVFKLPKEDCTREQSGRYWNLLLKESKTGVDGVKWLIDLAGQDEFYKNNITSSKDLYYKRIKLISRKRGDAPKIAVFS